MVGERVPIRPIRLLVRVRGARLILGAVGYVVRRPGFRDGRQARRSSCPLARGCAHQAAGRRLSAATLDRIRATLRAALNEALRAGLVEENPASLVALPPTRRPRAVVRTAARVQHWRKTGERPAVAVWTAAQTAQFLGRDRRASSVCGLPSDRAARAAPR